MSDFVTTSIPLIGRLTSILTWLLFINTLLVGTIILLAYRAIGMRKRIDELEQALSAHNHDTSLGTTIREDTSIDDDRPIPLARHRYGDASKLLHRQHRS